jgi:hypothetical protein
MNKPADLPRAQFSWCTPYALSGEFGLLKGGGRQPPNSILHSFHRLSIADFHHIPERFIRLLSFGYAEDETQFALGISELASRRILMVFPVVPYQGNSKSRNLMKACLPSSSLV